MERITDPSSHDAAIANASSSCMVVIYVTSDANPACMRTTPTVDALASKYGGAQSASRDANGDPGFLVLNEPNEESTGGASPERKTVRWFSMELTPQTAPMIKFGIQNTPIFICYAERRCETILGGDLRRLEEIVKGFIE